MPFIKGKTGNPGGRPMGLAKVVRETVGAEGWVEIVRRMYLIATGDHGTALAKDEIAAAAWLSDRGFGKAQQSVDVTSAGQHVAPGTVVVQLPTEGMSDAELEAMRSTLEAAKADAPADEDDGDAREVH